MADSKEVKPSKGKGKLISDTSDTIKENPEVFNHESDMLQVQNNNHGALDSKDKMTPEQMNAFISNIIETFTDDIDNDPKSKLIVDLVKGIGQLYEKVSDQKMWDSKDKMNPEQRNVLISKMIETFLDKIGNDPKYMQIIDLVKGIGELYEKVIERKAWALQKVAQSETMLRNGHLELQELRMAKAKMGETEFKRGHTVKSHAVKITEESVQRANCEAGAITDNVRRLELQNAQIRAETLAYKQSASKSKKELRQMLKREDKCTKRIAGMQNQTSALNTQYEKELLRAEQIEQELVQVEKKADELQPICFAGSKDVKTSKGKGKFKSVISDMIKVKPEVFNPESDVPRGPNNYCGPSDCRYEITQEQMNTLVSSVMATVSESEIENDQKAKQVVDLINVIRELHETVAEKKAWALQTVAQSKTRLDKDYLDLQELRMAKAKRKEIENKKEHLEESRAVKIMEESIHSASCQADAFTDAAQRLELHNAQIRADTLAYNITASESEKELREILKRGKKCEKKIADIEKQTSTLKMQYDKELLRAERMEQELIQAKKETEEEEIQWKQEIKEKEHMLALVAEETRMARTQNASHKAYLSKLCQQVGIECQVAKDERLRLEDEHRRLEDAVSRLRMPRPIDDLLPDNLDVIYNYEESASPSKSKSHLVCMICMYNLVSVVFLPCTHQVICFPCLENNCEALGGHCPYCSVGIEQSIKVYAPGS